MDSIIQSISPPLDHTCAVIDLGAFRSNLVVVRECVGPAVKVMAVLKSNAYGHGVIPIAHEAVRWGVDAIAVARLDEGVELRKAGIGIPILVCEIVPPLRIGMAVGLELDLTVSTIEGAEYVGTAAGRERRNAGVHIKVDTGMARLGLPWREASSAVESIVRIPHLNIKGIFSHFATSEDIDRRFAHEQMQRFESVLDAITKKKIEIQLRHMANSGAIFSLPEAHYDMVRPGIMIYGYPPERNMVGSEKLRPVMSLVSHVSHIRKLERGESVSYGRKYVAPADTTIAIVPIGYGDGFSRSLSNKSEVLIRGRRFPCVGTICMDHLMVEVGTPDACSTGDPVTLIGVEGDESISCWDIAEKMGTIPYEVTCLITPRVERVFRPASS